MLKPILLVAAAALLVFAGEGIYHAARGRQPVTLACDQLTAQRPPAPRVVVAGCEVDYAAAGYRESGGQVEELFLPARPAGGRAVAAPIVIATRDPGAIALARSVLGAGRVTSGEQSLDVMRQVVDQLHVSTSIDGLIRTGFVERLRSQRILSGLAQPIAENAVIVDLHGTPSFVRPGIALGLGALLAFLGLSPLQREAAGARAGGEPIRSGLPPPVLPPELASSQFDPELAFDELPDPPQPPRAGAAANAVPVSLPRLLLLALDVSAGPEAIETAPPLGSHEEVVAILCGVIPDLAVDRLHAVLARPDGSVRIALGPDDPVPTAVLEARGEAGVALVKEVLLMTGWRAFAPKTGLFVSTGDLEALAALAGEGPVG